MLQLNTPRAVTRPSDNMLMWSWYSDPFGTDAANENPAGAGTFKYNLRFAGQIFDGQAGLHANGLRDCYDPAIGRFCEPDPIGLAGGGVSPYTYAKSNPLDLVDPSGLFAIVVVHGGEVSITVPITYSGPGITADPTIPQRWNAAIQRMWSGRFGKYHVKTVVTNGLENQITVPCGNGRAATDRVTNSKGVWPALGMQGLNDDEWQAAHETGHLMLLDDEYWPWSGLPHSGYEHDIMGAWPYPPSEQDITNIIRWNAAR